MGLSFGGVEGYLMKGIDCVIGALTSSTFAIKQGEDSSYHRTEPVSIGPLYSVGIAARVLPKSRVH